MTQPTSPSSGGSPSTPTNSSLSQILLYFGGFAGLLGAVTAILKLKPDANSQSVTQARDAATEWTKIASERKSELREAEYEVAWWRARAGVLEVLLRTNGIAVPDPPPFNPPGSPPAGP